MTTCARTAYSATENSARRGSTYAHQVVRDRGQLVERRLVGEDRQPAIDLHRVGRDDLGAEQLGQRDGDLGLAQAGRPEQRDDLMPRRQPQAMSQPASP